MVFVAVVVIALGESGGAVMSKLRPQIQQYSRARIAANAQAHGLAGSPEYDTQVISNAVFTAEAGLSFFHTHGEGLGLIALLANTLVASVVPWRRVRDVLYALLTVGALFPLGYLVYGLATLERGRDAGVELAEWYVLAPLGSAAILGLLGLLVALALARPRARAE